MSAGFDIDAGPGWVSSIGRGRQRDFMDANFVDFRVPMPTFSTSKRAWLSGPKRDQPDARYRNTSPVVEEDVLVAYRAFLAETRFSGASVVESRHGRVPVRTNIYF
jgi:hypothetical protein